MLHWRLVFAAAILVPLLLALVLDFRYSGPAPGVWLVPLGLALAVVAADEVVGLLRGLTARPSRAAVMAGVAGIYLAGCVPTLWASSGQAYPVNCPLGRLGWPLCATAIGVIVLFVLEMRQFGKPGRLGQHTLRIALGTLVLVYIGLLLSFLPLLRGFAGNAWGMAALVSLILIVKMADTGAYVFGRLFGRHRMSPQLSPKKTVEGAAGGLLVAAGTSWAYFQWLVPWLTGVAPTAGWSAVVYGLILAVAGMVGDLAESMLKRDMQTKDSSVWLRGLGGVLDVLDSLLVAAPVAYLCWAAGLVGPGSSGPG